MINITNKDKTIIYKSIEDFKHTNEICFYHMNKHLKDIDNFFKKDKNQITFKNNKIIINEFEFKLFNSISTYIALKDNQEKYKTDLERIKGINFKIKLPPFYTDNFKIFELYNKYKDKKIKIVYLK